MGFPIAQLVMVCLTLMVPWSHTDVNYILPRTQYLILGGFWWATWFFLFKKRKAKISFFSCYCKSWANYLDWTLALFKTKSCHILVDFFMLQIASTNNWHLGINIVHIFFYFFLLLIKILLTKQAIQPHLLSQINNRISFITR